MSKDCKWFRMYVDPLGQEFKCLLFYLFHLILRKFGSMNQNKFYTVAIKTEIMFYEIWSKNGARDFFPTFLWSFIAPRCPFCDPY
jgi:hypothetical protein